MKYYKREPEGSIAYHMKHVASLEDIKRGFSKHVFKTEPQEHQWRALAIGALYDTWLFSLDMGLGKTKLGIDLATIKQSKTLVICPPMVMFHWGREIEKHSGCSYSIVAGGANEKIDKFCEDADFIIVSHKWLSRLLNKGNKFVLEKLNKFEMLLVDEAHQIKNYQTIGFNMYCRYLLGIPRRYLMTGTPIGQNGTDIWSMYYLLDKGLTFGTDFQKFTRRFFSLYMVKDMYPRYTMKAELKDHFLNLFWSKQIRWEEGECLQLECMNRVVIPVQMTPEQVVEYASIKSNVPKDEADKANILSDLMRVTAGVGLKRSPKMEVLLALIEECVVQKKDQIIVWCWLIEESEYIHNILSKKFKGLNIKAIRSSTSQLQGKKVLEDWRHGRLDVLIGNVKSIGVGVDLFEANKAIYYSNSFSIIDRKQAEKRIHRMGQKRQCFQIDIIAMGTVDEKIYDSLKKVGDNFDDVVGDTTMVIESKIGN